ncbi:hypothetical protein NMY22_g13360 [Coprinellus aureogranulatus]|nr:hypothetical protein NMY22_g13360 [Coprinellus aureogranulatus]
MFFVTAARSLPHPSEKDEWFSARRIFHVDGCNAPTMLKAHTPEEFLRTPILAALFDDPRSREMVEILRDTEGEDIYLLTAAFRFGQYFIAVTSKFYLRRHPLRRDRTEPEPTAVLLNGYVHLKGPYGEGQ